MGNCLSTPHVQDGLAAGAHASPGQYKAGKAAHDSVHSLDTGAGARDAAPNGSWGSSKQQKHHQKQQPQQQGSQKQQALSGQSTPHGSAGKLSSAESQHSLRKRKPPGIDLATGKPIPDFNVNGILDVLHELGSGGSGTTYLCRDLALGKLLAVKFVPRPLPKAAVPLMMAEVELQAQLGEGHVNIITMRELILTRTHLGLVMDYASGGALTNRVSDLWESALTRGGLHMDEQEACYYLRQFISAMDYLHGHKVAHRDLKLDNTLLEDAPSGPAHVRICDFGFAKAWTSASDNMKTAIGTPVYMSPQMLAAKQCASGYSGVKADMWAAGVLLFVMLLGAFPFDHAENLDPNSRQASNEVWLRQQAPGGWRRHPLAVEALSRQVLSPDCCDLLDGLLDMDEEKRFSTREVLSHPWMQQTLLPDQQRAWEALQAEQQAVTQDIALKSDVYKVRLRKQALSAMLAFAAKPPGRTSLLPQPSAALSPNASMSGANPATAAAAAAAVSAAAAAALATGSPVSLSPAVTAPSLQAAAAAAPAGPPGPQQQQLAGGSSSDAVPNGVGAAAGAQLARGDSIPEAQAVTLPAPSAASATSAAAASVASAPPAAAAAGGSASDIEAFRVDSNSTSLPDDRAQHMSFQAGEGLRSDSLEAKVGAYRQQLADLRAARIAAVAAQQQEQQQQQQAAAGNGPAAAAGRAQSPFAGAAAGVAAGEGGALTPPPASPPLSPVTSDTSPTPTPGGPTTSSTSASKQQQQVDRRAAVAASSSINSTTTSSSGSKGGSKLKKLFAGSSKGKGKGSGGAAASAGKGLFDVEDEWDDTPDEVWRIPLTSTADPAAYKLSPELSVAAGALVSQLQKNGKIEGRGRTNRSSCPVYTG